MGRALFARTGGYGYDRRILSEFAALGVGGSRGCATADVMRLKPDQVDWAKAANRRGQIRSVS
jgi:hypothetical protein